MKDDIDEIIARAVAASASPAEAATLVRESLERAGYEIVQREARIPVFRVKGI
jgi:predicted CoA-binding protein